VAVADAVPVVDNTLADTAGDIPAVAPSASNKTPPMTGSVTPASREPKHPPAVVPPPVDEVGAIVGAVANATPAISTAGDANSTHVDKPAATASGPKTRFAAKQALAPAPTPAPASALAPAPALPRKTRAGVQAAAAASSNIATRTRRSSKPDELADRGGKRKR
jgi:hypothetical protein